MKSVSNKIHVTNLDSYPYMNWYLLTSKRLAQAGASAPGAKRRIHLLKYHCSHPHYYYYHSMMSCHLSESLHCSVNYQVRDQKTTYLNSCRHTTLWHSPQKLYDDCLKEEKMFHCYSVYVRNIISKSFRIPQWNINLAPCIAIMLQSWRNEI